MFLKKRSFSDQSKIKFPQKLVFLLLLFQWVTSVQAQKEQTISLNDAIKMAKENNMDIQKSHIEQRISEKEIDVTKNLRLPEVNFTAMYSRLSDLTEYEGAFFTDKHTYTPEPGTVIYDAVTKFDMPLYAGNKINNAISKAKQENEIAKIKLEKTENDIQLDVAATFLGIYKMMELQKIIDESIKEEQERLKEVRAFKTFGTVTKNEVLRSELQLSDRELNSLTNKKNIKIALQDFKTLLQLPEEQEISIDTTAILDETNLLKDYGFYLKETMQNEEMRIASREVEVKKTELNMIKGNYYPKVGFFGNYNLKYPDYMLFTLNRPYLYTIGQIGVEASYNLSGLYKNKARVEAAKLKVELQENESTRVKNKMEDQVFRTHTQYQEILDKFLVTEKALELAKENYRIIKVKYLNQLVLITEMVDADNALLRAKFNKVSTRIDAVMKHYELLHTAGLFNK
ncbi:TolC family protein [Flavobacterium aquariorum]|uniref:TolC family protein n=1 Tax=Flavobacterium aquariorum TaxID=2217670 RepID=A0A2W7U9P6_9FLAO|nr:TolC family protein [Flavobacterium aquariorum]PZX91957.1 TolC family protein [Flavobacterium aquariorum]